MQFAELLANSHVGISKPKSCGWAGISGARLRFKAMLNCLTDQNRHLWGKPSLVQSDRVDQTVHVGAMEKWHHTNCCVLQVNSPRVSPSVALQTNQFMRLCTSGARFRSTSFSLTDQDYTFKPKPLSDLSGSRACLIVC